MRNLLTWVVKVCNLDTMTYRIQNLFIYIALTATLFFIMMMVGYQMRVADAYHCDVVRAQVGQGDTIWSVVDRHCDGNIRNAVDDTVQIRDGSLMVHANQWIILPGDP